MLKSEVQVWAAHVHTKRALFAAIAQQHNAAVQMADDECGNALACLQVCIVTKSVTKLCCSHAPSIRIMQKPTCSGQGQGCIHIQDNLKNI